MGAALLFRICNPKAHGWGFAIPVYHNYIYITGLKNKIQLDFAYFLTLTVVDWVDVFTRPVYKHIIIDSLRHCTENKGLEINAWVLMSNHVHLVASAKGNDTLSDILRDMKKFTSKKIVATIEEIPESRQDWMLYRFEYAGKYDKKIKNYKFWQDGNEPKEIHTFPFLQQKINYIHDNPVRAELVAEPHHYLYSSAIDYSGGKGLLPVVLAW